MDILSLLGFETNKIIVEPEITESESDITLTAYLKDEENRICPYCKSTKIIIKETRPTFIKHQTSNSTSKRIILVLYKRHYKCKSCGKIYVQQTPFVEKKHSISNQVRWSIIRDLKEYVSFSYVSRKYKISPWMCRTVFDEMVRIGRAALPTCLCIDEKRFSTDEGKYVCIIGNAKKCSVVDVIASRRKEYLNDYFRTFSQNELSNVKYFSSDMFEGYRLIKQRFFPHAIHIVDHFHVSKLFTETLQIIRKEYMSRYDKNTKEYDFIKRHWRLFLINPYSDKADKIKFVDNKTGVIYNLSQKIILTLKIHPDFLEIYSLYSDYCQYMQPDFSDEELKKSLDFLVNKALESTNKHINTLGKTLYNFYDEILNSFTSNNVYKISNAGSENINSAIQKMITVSHGLRSYAMFRKRVLFALKKED